MNFHATMLIDGRLLVEGDLIAVKSDSDEKAVDLHAVVESNPRYAETSAMPYGLLKTVPLRLLEDWKVQAVEPERVFMVHGTYYWLVIPINANEPDLYARAARVPHYNPEG